jgi:hypothetical protein
VARFCGRLTKTPAPTAQPLVVSKAGGLATTEDTAVAIQKPPVRVERSRTPD